jgi:hypothetical protein
LNSAPRVELMMNQFPDIELVSSLYADRCARCDLRPEQNVNSGSIVQAIFKVTPDRGESIGILMYELKRINADKFSEDEATCI